MTASSAESSKPRTCVFCGSPGPLTAEHVLGNWVSRLGFPNDPAPYYAGRLNRSPRELGKSPPFKRTVRDVCAACNNGWMGRLEHTASTHLPSFIRGESYEIPAQHHGAIATWVQKTALVGMLVSSRQERATGHGVPAAEYQHLYKLRDKGQPLPASQFWMGRYAGAQRLSMIQTTPVVLDIDGIPTATKPQAYVATVIVGKALFQGIRFTTPGLDLDVTTAQGLSPLWPSSGNSAAPNNVAVADDELERLAKGLNLIAQLPQVTIVPWSPATDLSRSKWHGDSIELPTPCGQHFVLYPTALALDGSTGITSSFVTGCDCGKAYIVSTERDGAHFKREGDVAEIAAAFEKWPGADYALRNSHGQFFFKR